MRRRGAQYWLWSNSQLQGRSHDESLPDGTQIEVQARCNRDQVIQVFVGLYGRDGGAIVEEFHDRDGAESLASALEWGCVRAQELLAIAGGFRAPHRIQRTLGVVLEDPCAMALRRMDMSEEEQIRLKSQDAWDEYLRAKEAMLALMRSTKVDSEVWETQKRRLRDAIDRRAALRRSYLSD
ncbi:hypothetical protein RG836_26500 [Pseudomonas sp. SZMC_28357]|uniref:hypothetical protein n=1 Tax=Pseudomonas sp. SZMC_28357 TaxID=3074380 RepID=UPI0028724642|nr:hypothetical protein [Pseudomonas sp. SZMC_28357]MDR9755001.1 hypothetical protein [Pseudomonas sp. SZMC_28357]